MFCESYENYLVKKEITWECHKLSLTLFTFLSAPNLGTIYYIDIDSLCFNDQYISIVIFL